MSNLTGALCLLFWISISSYGQTILTLGPRTAETPSVVARPMDTTAGGSPAAAIAGPTLGFVFDRGESQVRRIPGIAGAAAVGDPIGSLFSLANAYAAPQQDYVVGVSAADGSVVLFSLSHGAVTGTSPLTVVPPAPDRIAFSPSGDSLALFYSDQQKLIALTGIPQAPQIASSWDLTSYGGALTSLAIKDGGDLLVAGISQSSEAVLVVLPQGGRCSVLFPMTHPSAALFLWGSRDAVVSDGGAGMVYLFKNIGGSQESRVLSRPEDGLAAPDLLAVDRFGRTLVVGQSGEPVGLSIDVSQDNVRQFRCDCAITAFEPLNGSSIYRITALNGGRFVMMDASRPEPVFQTIQRPQTPADDGCAGRRRQNPLLGSQAAAAPLAGTGICRPPAGLGGLQ